MKKHSVPLHKVVADIVSTQARKRGFYDSAVIAHWQTILPPNLSRWTAPQRMKTSPLGQNQLIIGVVPAKITEMSYFHDMIKHHINAFFSFNMIDTVTFVADESLLRPLFTSQKEIT